MTTSTTTVTNRSPATAVLNRLITACNDGARAQRAASTVVGGNDRRARLEDSAGRRDTFVHELGALVSELGGTPTTGGSAFEGLRALGHQVDVLLIGDNGGDAYRSCARIEAHAEKLYARAAAANLPASAATVVARHLVEITADHAELRRRSMGG
jgi:uncharacterized protein (TIGR02284 family)